MDTRKMVEFFNLQNQIFGIDPETGEFFRLSECRIARKQAPPADWLSKLDLEHQKVEEAAAQYEAEKSMARKLVADKERKAVQRNISKFDRVFKPLKMSADDAKAIFHPVDFLVFRGMNTEKAVKSLVILDSKKNTAGGATLRKSIEKAVEQGRYEWITFRVDEKGKVTED